MYLAVFSQTGPGGVGSSSNNVLWLKADAGTSSITNGTPISSWNDQSGNGINVTQTVATQQPSFATNVINGMPAIQFDNVSTTNDKLIGPDSPILDNTSGYSFFNVIRPQNVDNNARTIVSKRTNVAVDQSFMLFFFTGSKFYVDLQSNNNRFNTTTTYAANNNYMINLLYDGTLAAASRAKAYTGETLEITATETSTLIPDNLSPLLIGTTDASDPRPFGGYISEVIIYTVTVNDAERIIINNYLSSKYDIALSANDKYSGDTPANGDYDLNVAGIGKETSGANPTFSASATLGMGIVSKSGLGNGDYLLAGHSSVANSVNLTDISGISGTNPGRWERVWYIDVTNAGAVLQADVEFDLAEGGMAGITPATASNYKLLYRSSTSGAWSEVATASSISGSRIIFSSYNFNNNADDGYYTIGTKNYVASPLPIELLDFNAVMNNKQVDITWSTATESNNDYYTIEKSKDGINFESVSTVDAAGNSLSLVNYKDIDTNPFDGISYYRLKQTDFDETFSYSKIVAVNYMLSDDGITIFPNPTNGEINISLKDLEGQEVLVVIIDATGRECFSKVMLSQENQQLIAIDSEQKLASGTYIITASSSNKLYSKKIIVK
jgi:hypothetical protein